MKISVLSTGIFVLMIIFSVFVSGCADMNTTDVDLSENEELKEEVFTQILNDRELLNEFMNEMTENPSTMNWMMEHDQFMQHMFTGENFEYMMEHNEDIGRHMMENMDHMLENDSVMRREWDMMHGESHMN